MLPVSLRCKKSPDTKQRKVSVTEWIGVPRAPPNIFFYFQAIFQKKIVQMKCCPTFAPSNPQLPVWEILGPALGWI